MAALSNPSEIAREVLRLLSTRRIPPTPDNYFTLYNEISGGNSEEGLFPERQCKSLLAAIDRSRPDTQRLARNLEQAIADRQWERFRVALADTINQDHEEPLPWAELIGDMLRQWETRHTGITPGKKREAIEHVLASGGKDPAILHSRLKGLLASWGQGSHGGEELALVEGSPPQTEGTLQAPVHTPDGEMLPELRELFAFALETAIATQLVESPELAKESRALATEVRKAANAQALKNILTKLKKFAYRLELLADDQNELRTGLLNLLQLLIENVSDLVEDDQWLHGQIEMVRGIVGSPLSLRAIDDAERRIKEVIYKQSQLKHSLHEAKEALRHMLAGFVDHLAEFTDTTSEYHDKIEICAKRIATANNITELSTVIEEVMQETRIVQLNAQRSRDELRATQKKVTEAEQRITELQDELDKTSSLVRQDQLTGALNRHGLEEAFEKECARTQRRRSALCVAVLDVDNFKRLNDSLGHDAGDAALIHLISVIKNTVRPADTVARFGGEEFVILLPDTDLDNATQALLRLQRELTKHYFMHDNQKILITFSAGVTEYRSGEPQNAVVKRADEAMYEAKNTGKNKVVAI